MLNKKSKIFISGHRGMVGSACWRLLESCGYENLIGEDSVNLDLRNQNKVFEFIKSENPDVIINAAAKVGGIYANVSYPYEFLMDNMLIQNNLISSSFELNIKKFIFLGSSCIYPKFSSQPIKEEYLLESQLEPTNQWYAIAKISGVKLIESLFYKYNKEYVSLMPTNLYGPYDNFSLENSHVLPALIRKFHESKINKKEVKLWGSGKPLREFLHVDDMAKAVLFALNNKLNEPTYNVGFGSDISIENLAKLIKKITGSEMEILWDNSKPDGTPKKLLDSSKFMNYGWKPQIELEEGIRSTYKWFLDNIEKVKK
ncbi:MAG: GDP-L-fucose synthase [Rickettsiales bacterium TMED289]|nr:MAG: GDP-L-fucose synthase [Rickettsiales bacterium TMED289]|tara:strand:- start:187 stop:1128 length:942 start_codon:yes stop_codon:yes gene_type:complete